MTTLIGVAPAAPILTGRPQSSPFVASEDAGKAHAGTPAPTRPKHTLDAISVGEVTFEAHRRSRRVGIIAAVVAVIALVVVGTHLSRKEARPRVEAAPAPAPTSATARAEVAVVVREGALSKGGASEGVLPREPAQAPPSNQHPALQPPKPKHSKHPLQRKPSPPPHKAH